MRLTVPSTATITTGDLLTVTNAPVPEANGTWPVTVVDSTHVDLGVAANAEQTRIRPDTHELHDFVRGGRPLAMPRRPARALTTIERRYDIFALVCDLRRDHRQSPRHPGSQRLLRRGSGTATQQIQNGSLNNLAAWKGTDGYVFGLKRPTGGINRVSRSSIATRFQSWASTGACRSIPGSIVLPGKCEYRCM